MTTVRKGAIATICNASTASVCNEAVQVEGLWIPVREPTVIRLSRPFRLRLCRDNNRTHRIQCGKRAMNRSWGREPVWGLQPYRGYDAWRYVSLIAFV